jgi:hypothetical protein
VCHSAWRSVVTYGPELDRFKRSVAATESKGHCRPIYWSYPALPSVVPTSSAPVVEVSNARAYRRAHLGRLMVLERTGVTEPAAHDFFRLEDVGTHPTGLLVTGIFENERRAHMMASAVRAASAAEIAARELN